MKSSPLRVFSIRAALAALLVVILVACGGGGGVPYTGVTIRPLSAEFTSRKAVAYGAYRTARNPSELDAEVITPAQLKQDLDLMLAAGFRMIRIFSSDDKVARQTLQVIAANNLNMKVQLGAFIKGDTYAAAADLPAIYADNATSIARAVALANDPAFKDIILAVSIGNETQVDFSGVRTKPETLAGYIRAVRNLITQPVTTDDNWLAWARMPAVITNEVDFASIHIYAQLDTFFDPKLFDWRQKDVPEASRAAAMMDAVMVETKRQYGEARKAFDSKGLSYIPITIGESGWNVIDPRLSFRAHPVNQKMYFDRMTAWAAEGRTGPGPDAVFYFVAFDEQWKQGDDGWGLFNKDRQARYAIQATNPNNSRAGSATWVWAPGTCSDPNALYYVPPVVKPAITEDRYTLFTDVAPGASEVRPTGLRWDAFDGNTAGYPEVTSNYAPGDATRSIEITPIPASFGWGLLRQPAANPVVDACSGKPVPLNGATDNLSNYAATGTLNFWISTRYPGKIEIGIITDTEDRLGQEAFLQIGPGNYGYCNTGAWCQVSIPLKDFTAKNPQLDLSLVLGRFVISDVYSRTGNAPGSTAKLYIDGINWSK